MVANIDHHKKKGVRPEFPKEASKWFYDDD